MPSSQNVGARGPAHGSAARRQILEQRRYDLGAVGPPSSSVMHWPRASNTATTLVRWGIAELLGDTLAARAQRRYDVGAVRLAELLGDTPATRASPAS